MQDNGKLVLVVDDKAQNRKLFNGLLSGSGYQVVTAGGGAECLALLAGVRPDLVILDVMMPDMDGFELCRRIRGETGLREMPILFVTAYPFPENLQKALSVGGNDLLAKPFDIDALLLRVASLLAAARHGMAAPVRPARA